MSVCLRSLTLYSTETDGYCKDKMICLKISVVGRRIPKKICLLSLWQKCIPAGSRMLI